MYLKFNILLIPFTFFRYRNSLYLNVDQPDHIGKVIKSTQTLRKPLNCTRIADCYEVLRVHMSVERVE